MSECKDAEKCRNRGLDCERCTRCYDYEEPRDYFDELDDGDER